MRRGVSCRDDRRPIISYRRLENIVQWSEVMNDPTLQDLPFKIELNRWGQIVMSPASNEHGRWQYEIARRIDRAQPDGTLITECSIQTCDGVKVADVAWASAEFISKHRFETPYSVAPELCVEIVSPSNSAGEIEEKVKLYLTAGATEVWVVHPTGDISYYNQTGAISASQFDNEQSPE